MVVKESEKRKPGAVVASSKASTSTAKTPATKLGSIPTVKTPTAKPSTTISPAKSPVGKVAASPPAKKSATSSSAHVAIKSGTTASAKKAAGVGTKGKAATPKAGAGSIEEGAAAAKVAAAEANAVVGPAVDLEEQARLKAGALARATEEMEELRKKAWVAQVEFERKEEAKRRKKAEEEAKRKKEEVALTKALLEAAFDGEDDELVKLLTKGKVMSKDMVDCCDAHGNTLLSEAAAGGSATTMKLLLDLQANPNSQGEFKRTPLWRAAFLGKADVVQPLLEAGADPRITNEAGESPAHVATVPAIKEAIMAWDVATTDQLRAKWEALQEQKVAVAAAERAQALSSSEDEVRDAQVACTKAQQTLRHACMELEKRIYEHDMCVEEKKPDELLQVTLDQIHAAEAAVAAARKVNTAACERLDAARFALREQQLAREEAGEGETLVGTPVEVKALDDVLIRDVGDKIKSDGRWPLVIDPSGQTSVFLRYQDSNYVNALSSHHMEPDRLRRSILGGIRYGKPVVVDLMDCDLWPVLPGMFDAVHKGLLDALLTKSLLQGEAFKVLIKHEDGEEYDINKFQAVRVSAFKLVFLTALRHPNADLVQRTYPLRVMIRG